MNRVRTAVLISGRGSNLAALLQAAASPDFPAEISLVVSNRCDAGGLDHAARYGVPSEVIDHKRHAGKADFEAAIQAVLQRSGISLVCLAGFMRLLTPSFVEQWRDRMINVHPSLLPLFKGLDTHERALAAGVRVHGATVHFVRAKTDTGPIIMQGAVPVMPGDTVETLSDRVLAVEHRIYPAALRAVASGRVRASGESVVWITDVASAQTETLIAPPF